MTLEERIIDLLRMSAGRCPYGIVVATEAERKRAEALLKGRKGAKLISIRVGEMADAEG